MWKPIVPQGDIFRLRWKFQNTNNMLKCVNMICISILGKHGNGSLVLRTNFQKIIDNVINVIAVLICYRISTICGRVSLPLKMKSPHTTHLRIWITVTHITTCTCERVSLPLKSKTHLRIWRIVKHITTCQILDLSMTAFDKVSCSRSMDLKNPKILWSRHMCGSMSLLRGINNLIVANYIENCL